MNMLENPRLLWVVIVGLTLGCVAMAYLWIDRSISLSYMAASTRASEEARDQAFQLLASEWKGRTPDEVLAKLSQAKEQSANRELVLKRDPAENVIWFGQLRFQFVNNRLSEVR